MVVARHAPVRPKNPAEQVRMDYRDTSTIKHDSAGTNAENSNEEGVLKKRRERAVKYFAQVKKRFELREQVIDLFVKILADHKEKLIDRHEVIKQVAALFDEDDELVLSFESCLPEGWEVRTRKEYDGKDWLGYFTPEDFNFHPLRPSYLTHARSSLWSKFDQPYQSPRDIRDTSDLASSNAEHTSSEAELELQAMSYMSNVRKAIGQKEFKALCEALSVHADKKAITRDDIFRTLSPYLRKEKGLRKQLLDFMKIQAKLHPSASTSKDKL